MDHEQTPLPRLAYCFVLHGHQDEVVCLAMSGDGRRLVSGSLDRTVRVWDVDTGRKLVMLRGQLVLCVAISPDGRRVFTGSSTGTIHLRDADTSERLASLRRHRHGIYNMFFQDEGRELVSWDVNDESRVWNATTGERLASGQLPGTMWVGPIVPKDYPFQFVRRGHQTYVEDAVTGAPIAVVEKAFANITASNTGRWAGSNGSGIYVFDLEEIHIRVDARL